MVIQERGFNLPPRFYPQFSEEIKTRGWTKLANPDWGCEELVHDFYANARIDEYEKEHSRGEPTYKAWFRGKLIDYSAVAIRTILDLPECHPYLKKLSYHEMLDPPMYKELVDTISIPGASWQRDTSCLMTQHLTWDARVWSQFTVSTLMPSDRTYSLTHEDALLIYCIIKQCPIDMSRIISEKIYEVANSSEEDAWLGYHTLGYLQDWCSLTCHI